MFVKEGTLTAFSEVIFVRILLPSIISATICFYSLQSGSTKATHCRMCRCCLSRSHHIHKYMPISSNEEKCRCDAVQTIGLFLMWCIVYWRCISPFCIMIFLDAWICLTCRNHRNKIKEFRLYFSLLHLIEPATTGFSYHPIIWFWYGDNRSCVIPIQFVRRTLDNFH